VPFSVKTNLDVAGYATTEDLCVEDYMAASDSPMSRRCATPARGARAYQHARSRTSNQRGSSLYGPTHNRGSTVTPLVARRAVSAAIASGMSPIGLGNDIGIAA